MGLPAPRPCLAQPVLLGPSGPCCWPALPLRLAALAWGPRPLWPTLVASAFPIHITRIGAKE